MNFTSPLFLIGFPIVWFLYPHTAPAQADMDVRLRNRRILLLAASWLFYMGGSLTCFPLLLLVTLVTYFGAIAIEDAGGSRRILIYVLGSVFAVLFFFKYFGFVQKSFFGTEWVSLPLPPGISFYTFQSLAYCIDVYRGDLRAERRFHDYALFVSFFPQLVAGPIERAGSLLPQLRACPSPTPEDTLRGFLYLLRGFFKKIVIADFLSPLVTALFDAGQNTAGGYTGPVTLLAGILFGFQIYADFSGYSDIAVGAARMLGIRLSLNFDRPYLAGSIRDFWRRWHITLTRWFTDYVYIPLGGSRRGTAVRVRNILIVFLLSGFWHGADWHFAAWGLYHGILLSLGVLWRMARSRRPADETADAAETAGESDHPGDHKHGVNIVRTALTFLLTSLGWILFRASSLRQACGMYAALARGWTDWTGLRNAFPASGMSMNGAAFLRLLLIPALLLLLHRLPEADQSEAHGAPISPAETTGTADRTGKIPLQMAVFLMLAAIGIAWLGNLAGGVTNAFIYFKF